MVKTTTSDVIVIGAGIVGACTALALTNAGLKVLIIDRGSITSGTTSSGEGNILVSDKEPGAELELARKSRELWFEINEDVGRGFELEAKGGIVVAQNPTAQDGLFRVAESQKNAGVKTEFLDFQDIRNYEPHLTHSIERAVFYPEDSQCQPMLATARIIDAVTKRGGAFLTDALVQSINQVNSVVTGVTTTRGTYSAPVVVNAAGTWAGNVADLAGSYLPIAPRRGFILVTAPGPLLVHHKVYDSNYLANVSSSDAELQTSAVIESVQSGNILIGASRERVGFLNGIDYSVLRILAKQAIALFPVLQRIQLMRAYRGFRPYTPDHLPAIGADPLIQGLWHNAGHEGAGIGLAPASASLITSAILQQPTFMDPTPFAPSRFDRSLQGSF